MQSDLSSSEATPAPEALCRQPRDGYVAVAIFACIGTLPFSLLLLSPKKNVWADVGVVALTALPLYALAACLAIYIHRAHIVAGQHELRWRHFGKERRVPWNEITDYYFLSFDETRPRATVDTPRGKIGFDGFTNEPALRDIVALRATNARANRWDLRGVRPEDEWPRSFSYDAVENRWLAPICGTLVLAVTLFLLTRVHLTEALDGFLFSWQWAGPLPTLVGVALALGIGVLMPASMVTAMFSMWRECHLRRDELVIATPEQLTWKSKGVSRTRRWDEVTRYYKQPHGRIATTSLYVVEAGTERLEWSQFIGQGMTLNAIVRRYAANSSTTNWRELDDILAEVKARKNHEESGQRIFDYHNRNSRAVIWLACLALFPAFFVSIQLPVAEKPASPTAIIFAGLCALVPIYTWWYLRTTNVRISGDGIEQNTPFGPKFISWSDVRTVWPERKNHPSLLRIVGTGITIWAWGNMGNFKDLHDYVWEHASIQGDTK